MFRLDGSSSLGFKLNQSAHLFNLFKMAANKSSRNGDVMVTSQVGQRGCKWVVQTVVQTGRASAGDGCSWWRQEANSPMGWRREGSLEWADVRRGSLLYGQTSWRGYARTGDDVMRREFLEKNVRHDDSSVVRKVKFSWKAKTLQWRWWRQSTHLSKKSWLTQKVENKTLFKGLSQIRLANRTPLVLLFTFSESRFPSFLCCFYCIVFDNFWCVPCCFEHIGALAADQPFLVVFIPFSTMDF